MSMTMTQKILAAHATGRAERHRPAEVRPGELVMAKLDLVLGNDITAPVAIKEFPKFGRTHVFDRGKIAMDGTPAEVFERAGELKDMGLTVPAATEIALALRARGVDIPESIYTINYLRKQLLSLRKGGGVC